MTNTFPHQFRILLFEAMVSTAAIASLFHLHHIMTNADTARGWWHPMTMGMVALVVLPPGAYKKDEPTPGGDRNAK